PQLCVVPRRSEEASGCEKFPQSHRHFHLASPDGLDPALPTTVSRPKRTPGAISIRLLRVIGASSSRPSLHWATACGANLLGSARRRLQCSVNRCHAAAVLSRQLGNRLASRITLGNFALLAMIEDRFAAKDRASGLRTPDAFITSGPD